MAEHLKAEPLHLPGLRHGFFTRNGGVSGGIYASLNTGLGSRDDPDKVRENRRRAQAALGADDLLTAYQVHSDICVIADGSWPGGQPPKADAIATARRGLMVGVNTADCGPVLFADSDAGVVAAAHAGWKGAIGGVLECTLDAMETLGAARQRIVAVAGPMIGPENYEVGPEFHQRFVAESPAWARFFSPSSRAGHFLFDLPGYVVMRLKKAGVGRVHDVARCTYAEEEVFFSYRRATHRGEEDYGRQLSAIMLAP